MIKETGVEWRRRKTNRRDGSVTRNVTETPEVATMSVKVETEFSNKG
jgi:hypothetical protein